MYNPSPPTTSLTKLSGGPFSFWLLFSWKLNLQFSFYSDIGPIADDRNSRLESEAAQLSDALSVSPFKGYTVDQSSCNGCLSSYSHMAVCDHSSNIDNISGYDATNMPSHYHLQTMQSWYSRRCAIGSKSLYPGRRQVSSRVGHASTISGCYAVYQSVPLSLTFLCIVPLWTTRVLSMHWTALL